jgi:hypothetical protein
VLVPCRQTKERRSLRLLLRQELIHPVRGGRIHRTLWRSSGGQGSDLTDRVHGLMFSGLDGHATNVRHQHNVGSANKA